MKSSIYFSVILSLIVLSSCKKDPMLDEPKAPQTMEELTVPANFDWKTIKEITISLSSSENGIVEVTNTQNVAYQKAFLSVGQVYNMKLSVPTYEKNIKIRFMGQEILLELNGTSFSHSF